MFDNDNFGVTLCLQFRESGNEVHVNVNGRLKFGNRGDETEGSGHGA